MAITKKPADILKNYFAEDRIISSRDMQVELEKQPSVKWVLKSKIPALDNLITGFYPEEVTVLSGITGEGKTTFCRTLTRNFMMNENRSLWFSYEMRPQKFLPSFGENVPEFFLPRVLKSNSLEWIFDRIHEGREKFGIRAVFVDHLHYLLDMSRIRNTSLQIGDLMRKIVETAHQLEIHFFLIVHMTKTKPESEPGKGDCRDSSFCEQEPDNVFYIWRKKERDHACLKVAKNRLHGVFNVKINLVKVGSYLEELSDAK